jgi:phage tail-like protein
MQPHTILRYLPENFQLAAGDERGVLRALLHVMDGMHAPVERVLKSIEQYVDPYRAPEPFVLMQAGWLGLDRYFVWSGGSPGAGEASFPTGVERLRLLIAELPLLVRNRGTRESLIRFLEVATGVRGFAIDASPVGKTFHFRVQVPDAARALTPFIEQIVSEERPAHATYEILIPETTPPAALKSGTGRRRASRSRKRRQKE